MDSRTLRRILMDFAGVEGRFGLEGGSGYGLGVFVGFRIRWFAEF